MEDVRQMRARHQVELEELQENCLHKEISDWIDYYWAPAHCGGKVRICNFCDKIMLRDWEHGTLVKLGKL